MKKLYLMALPLSLVMGSTNAAVIEPGQPHVLLESLTVKADPKVLRQALTVSYPTGFGAIRLASGSVMDTEMFFERAGNMDVFEATYLKLTKADFAAFKPKAIDPLDSNFQFSGSVVSEGSFKVPVNARRLTGADLLKDFNSIGNVFRRVDFHPALLKTSFTSGKYVDGKTAVMTFDVAHKQTIESAAGKSLSFEIVGEHLVTMALKKVGSSKRSDAMKMSFRMVCAKHPTKSDKTKGISAECTNDEFGPYNTAAVHGTGIDRYRMSLIGGSEKYFTNTVAFVPEGISGVGGIPTAGDYAANLRVTISVE